MAKKEVLIGDDEIPDVEAAPIPDDKALESVRKLARQQFTLIKEIMALEDQLSEKNKALKQNMEVDLPTKMLEIGMTDFGLAGGNRVDIKELIVGSIPKDDPEPTFDWLEEKGHGGLIKRRIEILFGREDIAWAKKFIADCAKRKRQLDLKQKKWVEPQTLSAFVREQLAVAAAQGKDPEEFAPSKLLGVFRLKQAIVSGPDVPKRKKK